MHKYKLKQNFMAVMQAEDELALAFLQANLHDPEISERLIDLALAVQSEYDNNAFVNYAERITAKDALYNCICTRLEKTHGVQGDEDLSIDKVTEIVFLSNTVACASVRAMQFVCKAGAPLVETLE
ncbi:MAG: hypothetical protein R3E13_01370 [Alphaproteobacteria bacterium]